MKYQFLLFQDQTLVADPGTVKGNAWSDYLEGSEDIIADWTPPIRCGNYNEKTKKCSGRNY